MRFSLIENLIWFDEIRPFDVARNSFSSTYSRHRLRCNLCTPCGFGNNRVSHSRWKYRYEATEDVRQHLASAPSLPPSSLQHDASIQGHRERNGTCCECGERELGFYWNGKFVRSQSPTEEAYRKTQSLITVLCSSQFLLDINIGYGSSTQVEPHSTHTHTHRQQNNKIKTRNGRAQEDSQVNHRITFATDSGDGNGKRMRTEWEDNAADIVGQ